MTVSEPKMIHDAIDTKQIVAAKLGVSPDVIAHIGLVPWDSRRGYICMCHCQGSVLFSVEVYMPYLMTIRDGDGADSFVMQGKCDACEKIYVAEVSVPEFEAKA